jgi:transposase
MLGGDLGIVNLATESEGEHFSGAIVHMARKRYHQRHQRLQKRGARNARRRIRRIGQREVRCQKDVNHCVSKTLIQTAVVARKAIALENWWGIQE